MSVGDGWNKSHELATQYAIEGLRALTLAQGGAVVAILSFAGNAGSERIRPALVASSLSYFAIGLSFALVVSLTSFIAQGAATHDRKRVSTVFEVAGIVLALASIALFVLGALTARSAFVTQRPSPLCERVDAPSSYAFSNADVPPRNDPGQQLQATLKAEIKVEACIHAQAYGLAKATAPVGEVADAVIEACSSTMAQAAVVGVPSDVLGSMKPNALYRVIQARAGDCWRSLDAAGN